MSSQALRDARRYEEENEQYILPEERPAFHLSTRVGWMNDPNGFSWYNGQCHLFYQYHPYDSHWGPMHWGHAVTTDFLHWKYLPAALAPDSFFDRDGCFSGGALTMKDGRHMLMYTGVRKEMTDGYRTREVQTQCVAFGDGENYEKYPGNPVLSWNDLPEDCSKYDFRDPRIWQDADGTYRAAIVSYSLKKVKDVIHDRSRNNSDGLLASTQIHEEEEGGQVLLFSARDPLHWKFDRKLAVNGYRIGRMWECPDLFELDGKQVLLASAMDMLPDGLEYHNGNGTFCLIGQIDPETGRFVPEAEQSVDYGMDFYAEQTVLTQDGRRIMIAWMQNWDTCNLHTRSIPWFGQMTLPRELSIKNGRLNQWPVRELLSLRKGEVRYENVCIRDEEVELTDIRGRLVDMELDLKVGEKDRDGHFGFHKFAIHFAKDDRYHTGISYRPSEATLKVDRKFSGSRRAIIHQRRAYANPVDGVLHLRVIIDRFSVEVFVNGGEKVMTMTYYTDIRADRISFFADGAASFDVTKYSLEEIDR
ncbi:MAG: glycoside hydrolase family 32 protein [Lachnospiraceae bacterium]|nr:glycoside hydrolase family 32 protein [Lachnospiraceae bacterium]